MSVEMKEDHQVFMLLSSFMKL